MKDFFANYFLRVFLLYLTYQHIHAQRSNPSVVSVVCITDENTENACRCCDNDVDANDIVVF